MNVNAENFEWVGGIVASLRWVRRVCRKVRSPMHRKMNRAKAYEQASDWMKAVMLRRKQQH